MIPEERAMWESARLALEAEQVAGILRGAANVAEARYQYAVAQPLRSGHPYLKARGLDGFCDGLRVSREGWLLVPATDADGIQGVQIIAEDGTTVSLPSNLYGCSYVIPRRGATVTVLVEELASGLACHRSLPQSSVIVAFRADNLARIRATTRGMVIVTAADWAAYLAKQVAERNERKGQWTTRGQVVQAVEAEIRDQLMRTATFAAAGFTA